MGPSEIGGSGRAICHPRARRDAHRVGLQATRGRNMQNEPLQSGSSPDEPASRSDLLPISVPKQRCPPSKPGERGTRSKAMPPAPQNHSGRPAEKLDPTLLCSGLIPTHGAEEDSC